MNTKKLLSVAAGLMLSVGLASAQFETNITFNVNQAIPDANANGLSLFANLGGFGANSTISDVKLSLNITGGFNGDLYAFLAGPNGGFSVLLNRVGVSNNASAFGYSDAGFNVTFSDSAANGDINFYQNLGVPGGQLNGLWQPDGRDIDPRILALAFFVGGTHLLAVLISKHWRQWNVDAFPGRPFIWQPKHHRQLGPRHHHGAGT